MLSQPFLPPKKTFIARILPTPSPPKGFSTSMGPLDLRAGVSFALYFLKMARRKDRNGLETLGVSFTYAPNPGAGKRQGQG